MSVAGDELQRPCGKPPSDVVLLVNHDLYPLYRDMLDARFSHLRRIYVPSYGELTAALARERPDVVLSFRIKGGGVFPREQLFGAPSVRWIHATSAGVDHLIPWDAGRIMVTNSGGIHGQPMGEYATWAVLAHVLRIPLYARQQREHRWKPQDTLLASDFSALVVGFGRVGMAVGHALKRLGMRVTGVRTTAGEASESADRVIAATGLAETIGEADFVIVALPKTPETLGLFDEAMLRRMKPSACLINVARGGIVDETALQRCLAEGALAAAVTDVAGEEPLPPGSPLWDAPNLTITPHVAADLAGWHVLAANLFADNLDRWLSGRPVINVCDPRRGY